VCQSGENRVEKLACKIALSVASTFVFLMFLEVGSFLTLRAVEWQPTFRLIWSPLAPPLGFPLPYRVSPIRMYETSSVYDGQAWAPKLWQEFRRVKLEYQPYVVWRSTAQNGEFVGFDSDGLRRTYNSTCDNGRAYSIWMFGGSTMWGDGAPDSLTIPSFLAHEYQRSGRPVCVRNYGQLAYVNTQEVIRLFLELKRTPRRPDLVIFYDGINDVFSLYQGDEIDVHENFDSVKQKLSAVLAWQTDEEAFRYLRGSSIYLLLMRLKRHFGRAGAKPPPPAMISEEDVKRQFDVAYLKNIDTVELLAREYGFACTFFWQPVIYVEHKPLTPEEQQIRRYIGHLFPGEEQLFQKMYGLARADSRPHSFYIADVFDNARGTLYIDDWHVGPEGNRLVAERMYEVLRQQGL
jgi:lysophospholipase L1-like esterase